MNSKNKNITIKLGLPKDSPRLIGSVLESYNSLEERLNELILDYFNPNSNRQDFVNILLNSSVLSFGAKCKLLLNMKGFDQKVVGKIRKLGNIRNGIAHNNSIIKVDVIIEENSDSTTEFVENKDIIQVMNSSGKIMDKDLKTEYNSFQELHNEISEYIQAYRMNEPKK